jgi:hypothetical protein
VTTATGFTLQTDDATASPDPPDVAFAVDAHDASPPLPPAPDVTDPDVVESPELAVDDDDGDVATSPLVPELPELPDVPDVAFASVDDEPELPLSADAPLAPDSDGADALTDTPGESDEAVTVAARAAPEATAHMTKNATVTVIATI